MAFELLKELVSLPTPTGFEGDGMRLIARSLESSVQGLRLDAHGNLFACLHPDCPQRVMLEAHCDEIGFLVQHIDEDGLLYLSALGGVMVPLVAGERVVFQGKNGPVKGVFAVRPIHLLSAEERKHVTTDKLCNLPVDIGATSREDALRVVDLGTPAVVDSGWREMLNGRVSCRGLDNRAGAYVVAEATRRLAAMPLNVRLDTVFSVQEEVGLVGGITAAQMLQPKMGFCVDVTFATDVQKADQKKIGTVRLGSGPVIGVGPTYHTGLRNLVEGAAGEIPFQRQVRSRGTGTCAWAMRMAGAGAAVSQISIPLRYMHTPIEVISLEDLEHTVDLVVAAIAAIPPDFELCERLR